MPRTWKACIVCEQIHCVRYKERCKRCYDRWRYALKREEELLRRIENDAVVEAVVPKKKERWRPIQFGHVKRS